MPTPQEFQLSCGVGVGACPVFSLFILTYLILKSIDIQGIYVGSREMFAAMNRAIALHQIQPVIPRVFPRTYAKKLR